MAGIILGPELYNLTLLLIAIYGSLVIIDKSCTIKNKHFKKGKRNAKITRKFPNKKKLRKNRTKTKSSK